MKEHDYIIKGDKYFENTRLDIVNFIIEGRDYKVLDIGGGSGNTLLFLKHKGIASEIHLFDIVNQVDDETKFDSVTIGDINTHNFKNENFDIIILADVLEHMVDPSDLLQKASSHLVKGGKLLVSMPNIQFIKAFYKIYIRGSFKYENSGIFDKTHMRFYCKADMTTLFRTESTLKINKICSINKFAKSKVGLLDKLTLGLFTNLLSMQFLFELEKV